MNSREEAKPRPESLQQAVREAILAAKTERERLERERDVEPEPSSESPHH
jgi:hypothetical protein